MMSSTSPLSPKHWAKRHCWSRLPSLESRPWAGGGVLDPGMGGGESSIAGEDAKVSARRTRDWLVKIGSSEWTCRRKRALYGRGGEQDVESEGSKASRAGQVCSNARPPVRAAPMDAHILGRQAGPAFGTCISTPRATAWVRFSVNNHCFAPRDNSDRIQCRPESVEGVFYSEVQQARKRVKLAAACAARPSCARSRCPRARTSSAGAGGRASCRAPRDSQTTRGRAP